MYYCFNKPYNIILKGYRNYNGIYIGLAFKNDLIYDLFSLKEKLNNNINSEPFNA